MKTRQRLKDGSTSLLRSQSIDTPNGHQIASVNGTASRNSLANTGRTSRLSNSPSPSLSSSLSHPRLRERKPSTTSTSSATTTTTTHVQQPPRSESTNSSTPTQEKQSDRSTNQSATTNPTQSGDSLLLSAVKNDPSKAPSLSSTRLQQSTACKRPQSSGSSATLNHTRVLPKRACSLLVAPSANRSNHQRPSLSKRGAQSLLSKPITPKSASLAPQHATNKDPANQANNGNAGQKVDDSAETASNTATKTASPKNYTREVVPKTRTLSLPRSLLSENAIEKDRFSKPVVRIELPEPQQVASNDNNRGSSLAGLNHIDNTKLESIMTDDDAVDRFSSTPKVPKRLGLSILAPVEALRAAASSSTTTAPSTQNLFRSTDDAAAEVIASLLQSSAHANNSAANPNLTEPIAETMREKTFNVIIAVTGSVATIKLIELVEKIQSMFPRTFVSKQNGITYNSSVAIRIVMTENSKHFMPKTDLKKSLNETIEIYDDSDEWSSWEKIGDPVLHIELRKWADLLLIAPLDANTMAKLANGLCDNLLSCIVRAWDNTKPLIYCPAMNVHMYKHPLTREHFCKLQSFNYLRVDSVEKRLACGDIGIGGMASVDSIAEKVVESLLQPISRQSTTGSRPLLDQQPTYPIISTSAHYESQQLNLKRTSSTMSRSNNAITTNNSGASTILMITDNLRRQKLAAAQQAKLNPPKPGAVTSVQNLRAVNYASGSDTIPMAIQDQYGFLNAVPTNGVDHSDDELDSNNYDEFDPTNLLEQTMTIGDAFPANGGFPSDSNSNINNNSGRLPNNNDKNSFVNNIEPTSSNNNNNNNRNISINSNNKKQPSAQNNELSKYNASQLLALCYSKHRDCFTCILCGHDYKNRKSMARHLKEQHVQGNIFHCGPCGVSFKRREKLLKHQRDRHNAVAATNVVVQ